MNKFQLDIVKQLLEYTSPVAVGDVLVSVNKGPSEVVVELRLISKNMSFWVYEDGAQVKGEEKLDTRFEIQDFRNLAELASAFLGKTKEILGC